MFPNRQYEKILHAVVSADQDGANTVIAAITGRKIYVLAYALVVTGTGGLTWKSNTTALSGAMAPATAGIVSSNGGGWPLMETIAGEALILTMGASTDAFGHITYGVA